MQKLKFYTFVIFIIINAAIFPKVVYVAPDGNDTTNTGTIDSPYWSVQKAQSAVSAGDTVYIRGGEYTITESDISNDDGTFASVTYLNKSGKAGNLINYFAYTGEKPVFNLTAVKPSGRRVVGFRIACSYIHLKGIEITGVQVTITTHTESYCIYSNGNYNNNIFEQISMHDNVGTGLRYYKGGGNLFLNCDAYRNWDNVSENQLGGNTDGFGCHPSTSGTGNVFKGCRSWFNSDDGFDIIRSGAAVTFDSCWSFYNGYSTSFQSLGDGNGFKAGGFAYDDSTKIPNPVPRHIIEFCIATRNKANGFYANHHLAGNYWYNNSAYQNSTNFNMLNRPSREDAVNIDGPGYDHVLKNNLSYQKGLRDTANIDTSRNTLVTNSWQLNLSLTDSDFKSLNIDLLTSPRKVDGSLPDVDFMRPSPGSELIDAGTDIGFAFSGKAPDIGAIETDYPTEVKSFKNTTPNDIVLYQNYPNPFNPVTKIKYSIPERTNVLLTVYDILGTRVATLIDQQQNTGSYKVNFNPSLINGGISSGVYFYTLKTDAAIITKKLIYLK
jgi:hypothetical protein